MKDSNRFYVYSLQDPSTLEPFYIGKGSNGRIGHHFRESQAHNNPHKWNKVQKLLREGFTHSQIQKKLATGLPEDLAYELEAFLISETGLENLTNVMEGGEGGPSLTGENSTSAKITAQEAAHIKWLCENSDFGYQKLHDHYEEDIGSSVTKWIFASINYENTWRHVKPEKPSFWDEEWENQIERQYEALCEWKTTGKSSAEVAEGCEFTKDQIKNSWERDCFDLKSHFLEEHPNYLDEQKQELDRRYEALCEWRLGSLSAGDIAEKYGFTKNQILHMWRDYFGLKTRFLDEHPNYLNEKQKMIERRYEAMSKWRLTDATLNETAEQSEFTTGQIRGAWESDYFGLRTRFLDHHPLYEL